MLCVDGSSRAKAMPSTAGNHCHTSSGACDDDEEPAATGDQEAGEQRSRDVLGEAAHVAPDR